MLVPFGLPLEPRAGELKIARENIQGVHLTLLRPDGRGKVEIEPSKIAVGPSAGTPLVLASPGDGLGLVIGEGLEDGLSVVAAATGVGVWAAGSASRLPQLAACIPGYIEVVTLLEDDDDAGRRGVKELARALAQRDVEVRVVRSAR